MVDEARREAVQSITAVGTAALRIAPNGADFANAAQSRTDVVVEIISGEEEARLAFLATSASLPLGDGRIAVFDSGGGSSQFTYGERGRIEEQFSVNVGAARFTDQFGLDGAVDRSTLDAALEAIAADLDALDRRARPDAVVGMGGTSTNLAAVKHGLAEYDADVVHGTVLGLAELDRQIELYRTRDADARRSIVGLQPKRAEVVLAGACIVRTIVTKLGHHSFTVSDRGLRHGVFAERFTVRG
jgi:exopolyphosphatase/guanosine-5'-triphosphate,3'-diphosphate pyrophosphatase